MSRGQVAIVWSRATGSPSRPQSPVLGAVREAKRDCVRILDKEIEVAVIDYDKTVNTMLELVNAVFPLVVAERLGVDPDRVKASVDRPDATVIRVQATIDDKDLTDEQDVIMTDLLREMGLHNPMSVKADA